MSRATHLAAGLVLASVIAVARLEAVDSFGLSVLPCCGAFALAAAGTIVLVGSALAGRASAWWPSVSVAASAVGIAAGVVLEKQLEARSRRTGDRIAAAVERYAVANGSCPERLDELVPPWLDSVPATSLGVFRSIPFHYDVVPSPPGYVLRFPAPAFLYWERRLDGSWRLRD